MSFLTQMMSMNRREGAITRNTIDSADVFSVVTSFVFDVSKRVKQKYLYHFQFNKEKHFDVDV